MNPDPSDLIAAGRSSRSCVNGLCDKPIQCGDAGFCCDALPPATGGMIPVVLCKLCGALTPMLNTRLCDHCWEIDRRIGGWTLWQHLRFWWRNE